MPVGSPGTTPWDLSPRSPREQLWREWCFVKAVIRHRGWSLLVLVAVLAAGGVAFALHHGDRGYTFARGMYATFSLIFANPSEPFDQSGPLWPLYFLVPVIGLTVILEAIVEVSGMVRDRRQHEPAWCRIMASSMNNHVIIVGLGRLGYRTFTLLRRMGVPVVVIERDEHSPFLDEVRREGSAILIGDGRRDALLREAGVERARSLVCATQDDLANLEMALDAKRFNRDIHVVVRMFDQAMADKLAGVVAPGQIRVAMSQSALAAPVFATAALDARIVASFLLGDTWMVLWRQPAGPLAGLTVEQVRARTGALVVRLGRQQGERLLPGADEPVGPSDELTLQGPLERLIAAGV